MGDLASMSVADPGFFLKGWGRRGLAKQSVYYSYQLRQYGCRVRVQMSVLKIRKMPHLPTEKKGEISPFIRPPLLDLPLTVHSIYVRLSLLNIHVWVILGHSAQIVPL